MIRLLASSLMGTLLLCGCNGSGNPYVPPSDDGSAPVYDLAPPPPPLDLAQPPDLVMVPMFTCGNSQCPVGELCCVTNGGGQVNIQCTPNSCPSGALTVQCDGPAACGGNPCCAPFKSSNGMPAAQNVTCGSSPSDCPPAIDFVAMSGTSRLCSVDGDCTSGAPNSQLPDCCTGVINGQRTHFCFNKMYVSFAMGVTCP
jgi:hypothetical protein